MINLIRATFNKCLAKERFIDNSQIKEANKNPELKDSVRTFYKSQKFNEDDRIQFNWFIGNTFNLSLSEFG